MSNEPLEPLAAELQDLLRSERQREPLAPEMSARIRSQVAASVGTLSAPPPAPITEAVGVLSSKLPLVIAAFVIGGLSGSALTWSLMQRSQNASQVQNVSAVVVEAHDEPAAPVEKVAVSPEPSPAIVKADDDEARAVDAGVRGVVHDPDRDLAAERSLMEQARSSLAHSRWNDALLSLDKHRSRFSRGKLAEERDSMRVPTLVMLGRYDDARAAAQRFHARYPTSIFATGVDQAVRSIP